MGKQPDAANECRFEGSLICRMGGELAIRADGEGVDDAVWVEVIRKMDEVYADLVRHEIELEEKNRELEASHRFVHSVLSAMSDILVVCTADGSVQQVNDAFCALTGEPVEALVGRPLANLFADEASRRRLCDGSRVEAGVKDCEVQFRAADGSALPVAVSCSALASAAGRAQGMVLVGRPVGELRRAYEALSEAHESLKRTQQQLVQSEKLASLGRLVAGVAHELNNPLSFVLGNVHALRKYLDRIRHYLDAEQHGVGEAERSALRVELRLDHLLADLGSLLDGTVEGAERAREIVEALRRFSAMDRGEEVVFALDEVIERSVHWVQRAVPKPFEVRKEVVGPLCVRGSPAQLQQVLINLVSNAYDAAEEVAGGPQLQIRGELAEGRVRVVLCDNGCGIASEDLGRLFDPFFTTKPVGKGTGLGLSISFGIVEHHGGTLSAANAEGGGAEFTLTLPAAELSAKP